jgi:hypothetical protein
LAVAGSRRQSAEQAARGLADKHNLQLRAYGSLAEMLASEPLDAVAICSPQEFHRQHLIAALNAGVHVLCEKPLVFEPTRDVLADAEALIEGFAAAGKVLMVNEQWPYTLAGFERLYPDLGWRQSPPRAFSMLLSPDATGPEMVPNALPHALSLLFTLAPTDGQASDIQVAFSENPAEASSEMAVAFRYRHRRGVTNVHVAMRRVPQPPRPAGYQIDGRWAFRRLEMPGYQMFLQSEPPCEGGAPGGGVRCVPLDDPLRRLLADFLNRCRRADERAESYRDASLLNRLAILHELYRAACARSATTLEHDTPPPIRASHYSPA